MLAVGPSFQKRGVGRALVRWGTDLARADPGGPLPAFLEASVTGEQFYRKIGFLTLGWDELPDPDAPQGVCKWPYMCTCAPAVTE
jgi:predicted N-acetyltransferase YhbS